MISVDIPSIKINARAIQILHLEGTHLKSGLRGRGARTAVPNVANIVGQF